MNQQKTIFKNKACIFDFDSTLVSIESLDFLLSNIAGQSEKQLEEVTNLAMNGMLSFRDSLISRFKITQISRYHVQKMCEEILNYITNGVRENVAKLHEDSDIYIVSGGFLEIIHTVANTLNISQINCFANQFIYNGNDVIGFNKDNALSDNGGKPKIVHEILDKHLYQRIFMIGDGYTDLEVAKEIPSVIFCGYGEHIQRQNVFNESKHFFYNFADLTQFIVEHK